MGYICFIKEIYVEVGINFDFFREYVLELGKFVKEELV